MAESIRHDGSSTCDGAALQRQACCSSSRLLIGQKCFGHRCGRSAPAPESRAICFKVRGKSCNPLCVGRRSGCLGAWVRRRFLAPRAGRPCTGMRMITITITITIQQGNLELSGGCRSVSNRELGRIIIIDVQVSVQC